MDVLFKQLDLTSMSSKLDKLLFTTDSTSNANSSLIQASLKILIYLSDNVQHRFYSKLPSISERIMGLYLAGAVQTCTPLEEFRRSKEDLVVIQLRLADISTPTPLVFLAVFPRGVEMEKRRAPSFTGKTIDYSGFRREKMWLQAMIIKWSKLNIRLNKATRRIIIMYILSVHPFVFQDTLIKLR